jgi:phosphatidyl-myo-inositol dimannoside synthase
MQKSNVLFLGLTVFSKTGGIEKFNKSFIKVLDEEAKAGNEDFKVSVLHDEEPDARYINESAFTGYKGNRFLFVLREIFHARKFGTIIIGHINLAIVAIAIKKLFPRKKVAIVIHGVEAMEAMGGIQKKALDCADEVWTVSEFTKNNLRRIQDVPEHKIVLFHNTIDPYFNLPQGFSKPSYLKQRYNIQPGEQVLFSLTRMNHTEGYKGYDQVIRSLPAVLEKNPGVRYFIAGKGDEKEVTMVKELISELKLEGKVELLGYVSDEELTDHYLLSDLFVLPSKKEGFGIVFIEAMACGLPVIAGNKDGSVDALRNGQLGTLVDPDNTKEIAAAILASLAHSNKLSGKELQQKMLGHFGFDRYRSRLLSLLEPSVNGKAIAGPSYAK